jgi:hypothetical protein
MAAEETTRAGQAETNGSAQDARDKGLAWLWAGMLVAPVAFLLNLQANYTLTQQLCPGGRMIFLHALTLFFLLAAAGGGLIALRNWKRAGRSWPDESGSRTMRNRFMGAVGVMMSVLCLLIIIAQWIPQFIFNPCQR